VLIGRDLRSGEEQPVAWTYQRPDGGRSFYTSLGHPADFEDPSFRRLLLNATYWAAGLPVPPALPSIPAIPPVGPPDSRSAAAK
jgi:type 1 glutamine amidotransferase